MSNKIKAVVCGVNFGSFYIKAIEQSSKLALCGILSKGSDKSRKISEEYHIPLYTDADEINDADVVIMATRSMITGGRSSSAIKKFLKKGIPVLQEQPVHHLEVKDMLSAAENNVKYAVNDFYRYLPSVSEFLSYAEKLRKSRKLLRFRLSCTSQVLYPLIDILYSAAGKADSFNAEKVSSGAMSVITGEINGIPYVLDYYNEYTENIDSSLALFFDMKIDTDSGNLILTDPVGDVLWQPHLSCFRDTDSDDERYDLNVPIKRLFSGDISNYSELYSKVWPQAMEKSIFDFINAETAELKTRILRQCEMCSIVTQAAGAPVKIETPYIDTFTF